MNVFSAILVQCLDKMNLLSGYEMKLILPIIVTMFCLLQFWHQRLPGTPSLHRPRYLWVATIPYHVK